MSCESVTLKFVYFNEGGGLRTLREWLNIGSKYWHCTINFFYVTVIFIVDCFALFFHLNDDIFGLIFSFICSLFFSLWCSMFSIVHDCYGRQLSKFSPVKSRAWGQLTPSDGIYSGNWMVWKSNSICRLFKI